MVEIELDAFSGRPNPRWPLDDAQAAELLALLADLPAAAPRPHADLGYRGFLVHRGGALAPIRVGAGTVEIDGASHADRRAAEAWLLRNARALGWAAVVEGVVPP
ncbi:MAG TPA: hypothetical protein PLB41_05455 [Rubrivivax sp.]|nr:hypothetical protein [Rubrivivax sp.]HPO17772.1 hypothetical protein [Rubrivivax sp.]